MKQLLLSIAFSLIALAAAAVPAKRGISRTITLADGRQVKVELRGDEFAHWWQTADGTRYELSESLGRRANARRAVARRAMRRAARGGVFRGTKRGLIILAQFPNQRFSMDNPQTLYERIANEEGYADNGFHGSIADYFHEQSGGQFDIIFDVAGPVTMSHNYSYYGANSEANVGQMIKEACMGVDSDIDFSQYDWDGDGEAEEVFVLYAGYGEADSQDEDLVWPLMYNLKADGINLTLDGTTIDIYACSNELSSDDRINGIGTFCHEFSHCMGFPDLYDTGYSGNYGMGSWDLMDYGCYNGEGFLPCGYTAYEKMTCGWTTPVVLNRDTTITSMAPLADMGQTFIIRNNANSNEFYTLENRQLTGFDAGLAGHGMIISHIDYDADLWGNNAVNTTQGAYAYGNDHQRITIFHADNDDDSRYWDATLKTYTRQTEGGDPYPHNGNDSLTPTSRPAAALWNANSSGSLTMPCTITSITENEDGTMAFTFRTVSTASAGAHGDTLFFESFDQCPGRGGNDGVFKGSIATGQLLATMCDNAGWTYSHGYNANKCAKFGVTRSGVGSGDATTPAITLRGDTVTLSFRAAGWDASGDGTSLEVSLSGNARFADSGAADTILTMVKGAWQAYTLTLVGSGRTRITFLPHKRFFLDDVLVMAQSGDHSTTAITCPAPLRHESPSASPDTPAYNLQGQRVGRSYKGLMIKNGKKTVVKGAQ